MATYEVQFLDQSVGKVEADLIRESSDSKWLVFVDEEGEVQRFRTADVRSVNRVKDE